MEGYKKEYQINREADMVQVAKEVLSLATDLVERQTTEGAILLALSGDLGAGKTTFTKYLAKELGIDENLSSPTFVIMKKYLIKDKKLAQIDSEKNNSEKPLKKFSNLIHIDAYRIANGLELEKLGFKKLMETSSLICLEWPEIVADILPSSYISIKFEHIALMDSSDKNDQVYQGDQSLASPQREEMRKVTVEVIM